ncbi:hypothetical protein ACM66B_001259 [Microbotryomycetes sp. NB124-2]
MQADDEPRSPHHPRERSNESEDSMVTALANVTIETQTTDATSVHGSGDAEEKDDDSSGSDRPSTLGQAQSPTLESDETSASPSTTATIIFAEEARKRLDDHWEEIEKKMPRYSVSKLTAAVGIDTFVGPLKRLEQGVLVTASNQQKGAEFCDWLRNLIAMPSLMRPGRPDHGQATGSTIPSPPSPMTCADPGTTATCQEALSDEWREHTSIVLLYSDSESETTATDDPEESEETTRRKEEFDEECKMLESKIHLIIAPKEVKKGLDMSSIKVVAHFNFVQYENFVIHRVAARARWQGSDNMMDSIASDRQEGTTTGRSMSRASGPKTVSLEASAQPKLGLQHQSATTTEQGNVEHSYSGEYVSRKLLRKAYMFEPTPGRSLRVPDIFETPSSFAKYQANVKIPDEVGRTQLSGRAFLRGSFAPTTGLVARFVPRSLVSQRPAEQPRKKDPILPPPVTLPRSKLRSKLSNLKTRFSEQFCSDNTHPEEHRPEEARRINEIVAAENAPSDKCTLPLVNSTFAQGVIKASDTQETLLANDPKTAETAPILKTFRRYSDSGRFQGVVKFG